MENTRDKFRAWHKATELMDEVVTIDLYDERIGVLYANPITQGEDIQRFDFDEIELMQYTGLKDKNGVQIFEGDIYRYEYLTGSGVEYRNAVVEWETTEVAYEGVFHGYELNNYEIEVIGNIYEHKHLLE